MAVQISGNDITVPRDGTFSRNVSIAGTLTYEDVTNVDSIGLVTARNGIEVGASPGVAASISVDGNAIFSGITTVGTGLSMGDNVRANFGASGDLQIYHDSNNSIIQDAGTGELQLKANSSIRNQGTAFYVNNEDASEAMIAAVQNGAVTLYNDNSAKLATSASGVTVNGTVAATSYTGDGSALTGIVAGVQTEAASISGITTYLDLTKDDHELVVTGTNTISVIGGSQGDSHTLRIENSGIATVTLDSTYFKFPSGGTPAFPIASGAKSLVSFTVHKAGAVGVNTFLMTGVSVSFS